MFVLRLFYLNVFAFAMLLKFCAKQNIYLKNAELFIDGRVCETFLDAVQSKPVFPTMSQHVTIFMQLDIPYFLSRV